MRVLIVEDERLLGDNLQEYLRRRGWNPLLARDGRTALACAAAFLPAVILLDYQLPDMDGFQLLAGLRSGHGPCGCILMTALSAETIVRHAPRHGIRLVLHKPFALSDMELGLREASAGAGSLPGR
jgi:DNA-binding response OmpR family regulator